MDFPRPPLLPPLLALALAAAAPLAVAEASFSVRLLTPETALKAAQAALKKCRESGFQVTIAVVDRMGVTQVLLRDRFAGPHTTDMAAAKAYTAVSFRTNTSELAAATQPGQPQSGVRHRPGVAGQHDDLHVHLVQALDGLARFRPDGIRHGERRERRPVIHQPDRARTARIEAIGGLAHAVAGPNIELLEQCRPSRRETATLDDRAYTATGKILERR